jgi:hypothetical protein
MPIVRFKILDHLGLGPPEAESPPPQRDILRVAEHREGRGVAQGEDLEGHIPTELGVAGAVRRPCLRRRWARISREPIRVP